MNPHPNLNPDPTPNHRCGSSGGWSASARGCTRASTSQSMWPWRAGTLLLIQEVSYLTLALAVVTLSLTLTLTLILTLALTLVLALTLAPTTALILSITPTL